VKREVSPPIRRGIPKSLGRIAIATFSFALGAGLFGPLAAKGADVTWHIVTNHLPVLDFTLAPVSPTTTNTVSFVAPTDGQIYGNACWASVANGDPSLAVDATNQTITVWFSPPLTNRFCPLYILPVSGVEGHLGQLKAGTWAFHILQNSYTFSVVEAPLLLSVQALSNSSSLQLSWPVSGDTFVLEFNSDLASGNWQAVTNLPTISSNRNTVQILSDSNSRFFRLRRLDL